MMRVIPQKLTNGTDTTDTTSYSACAVCNSGFVCWLTSTVDGNPSWDLFRPSVTVWETLEIKQYNTKTNEFYNKKL